MKKRILGHPNKELRRIAREVKKITPRRKDKIKEMIRLMHEHNGIGLAATQIGWNARVFVMNTTGKPDGDLVFVNPKVLGVGGDLWGFEEGCLSVPGMVGVVERRRKVKVQAYDIDGKGFICEDHDLAGRCMLHEIDHLDGILFIDRAKELHKGESIL